MPVAREEFRVCRLTCCRYGQLQLRCCAARNADLFADQPVCLSCKLYGLIVELLRRRDLLHQQDFIFIAVCLDVSRIDCFQGNWPLNLANFPAQWQFPFQFCWQTGVAGERPIGVPMRSHPKQQSDSEWLSGNNGVCIGKKLGFNEFFSLINLPWALRRQSEERPGNKERRDPRYRSHVIT